MGSSTLALLSSLSPTQVGPSPRHPILIWPPCAWPAPEYTVPNDLSWAVRGSMGLPRPGPAGSCREVPNESEEEDPRWGGQREEARLGTGPGAWAWHRAGAGPGKAWLPRGESCPPAPLCRVSGRFPGLLGLLSVRTSPSPILGLSFPICGQERIASQVDIRFPNQEEPNLSSCANKKWSPRW